MAEKQPCKECGKAVLSSTLERTGGKCMPCFKKEAISNIEKHQVLAESERPTLQSQSDIDWGVIYEDGRAITFVVVFIGCYIYAIASYGFLFGVGLGWLPSVIIAGIAAVLWPLAAILIAMLVLLLIGKS